MLSHTAGILYYVLATILSMANFVNYGTSGFHAFHLIFVFK